MGWRARPGGPSTVRTPGPAHIQALPWGRSTALYSRTPSRYSYVAYLYRLQLKYDSRNITRHMITMPGPDDVTVTGRVL